MNEFNELKELGIKVWDLLAREPKRTKETLPLLYKRQLAKLKNECPFCEYYFEEEIDYFKCNKCPLYKSGNHCIGGNSYFQQWNHGNNKSENARTIADAFRAWEKI